MTDVTLDLLLQDWTTRHVIPVLKADAIRDTVLASPRVVIEELPSGWWDGFSIHLASTLRRATTYPTFSLPLLAPAVR